MEKIAILGLHLNYGGVEQSIVNQANALADTYEVELVISYKLNKNPAFKINPKVKIIYLTNKKPNKKEFKEALKRKKIFQVLKEGIKSIRILYLKKQSMKKYIKNSNAKIIISSRVDFTKLLSKYKKKNIITIAEEHCHHNNNQKYIKKVKKACKNIDYLIPVSKELTNFYNTIINTSKCIYIPNCLNFWSEESSKLDNKNLISVGRLSPEKGFLDLIDVFSIIYENDKDFHLDIIGDGVEFIAIKEKIKQKKLNNAITLWGYQNNDFIKEKLKQSSLYLMCSFEESFGIVLIEAASMGVPSLAFNSAQGACEIITNDNNGYLILDRNKQKMASKTLELIGEPKKLMQLGKNAKKMAEAYKYENIQKKWIKFIADIIKERKGE